MARRWRVGLDSGCVVTDDVPDDARSGYCDEGYYGGKYAICESIQHKRDADLIAVAPEMYSLLVDNLPAFEENLGYRHPIVLAIAELIERANQ